MANLKDFFNKVSNNNRIYTAEDIGEMSGNEFSQNEKAIDYQMESLGIPRRNDLSGNSDVVYVHAYTRSDGTEVKAHYRSRHGHLTGAGASVPVTNSDNQTESLVLSNMKPADFSTLEKRNPLASYNASRNANRPDARELMNIAISRFENLPEHPEFYVFQPDAVEYVNNQLNIKTSKGLIIPENWHGVIYDKNSGFGKRLSNSPELQNQVMQNYDRKTRTFTKNQILIDFKQDKNLNYSIGHGTILNPHIKNGEFRGTLFDKYDFKWLSKEQLPNLKTLVINNGAYVLQISKHLKNFYVIVPIKFKVKGN